jgi:cyclo(L-tyrosyl-L-tyrosyl) synthase
MEKKIQCTADMNIKEYSPIGEAVLSGGVENNALIIGISLYNSYFTEQNIEKIFLWATSLVSRVFIMIPDEPMVHTLVSLGKKEVYAQRVARLRANNLENKCRKIIGKNNLNNFMNNTVSSLQLHQKSQIQIIRWKRVVNNDQYQSALVEISTAYKQDTDFKKCVNEITCAVFQNWNKIPTPETLARGVRFLLEELAFIMHSNQILDLHENDKIAYVYHHTMPVLQNIIGGKYIFKSHSSFGFITAEVI